MFLPKKIRSEKMSFLRKRLTCHPKSKKQTNPPRKKFLIFWQMELSDSKIKKLIIFPEREPCTFQPRLRK